MGAVIVSGVNSPPILEPAEHVFNLVALFVERGIMRDNDLAACS